MQIEFEHVRIGCMAAAKRQGREFHRDLSLDIWDLIAETYLRVHGKDVRKPHAYCCSVAIRHGLPTIRGYRRTTKYLGCTNGKKRTKTVWVKVSPAQTGGDFTHLTENRRITLTGP